MPFSSSSLSKSNNLKKSLYGLEIQRVNVFKEVSDNKRLGFTAEPAEVILKQLHKNEAYEIYRVCRQMVWHTPRQSVSTQGRLSTA